MSHTRRQYFHTQRDRKKDVAFSRFDGRAVPACFLRPSSSRKPREEVFNSDGGLRRRLKKIKQACSEGVGSVRTSSPHISPPLALYLGKILTCVAEMQRPPVGPINRPVHDDPPAQQRLHKAALSPTIAGQSERGGRKTGGGGYVFRRKSHGGGSRRRAVLLSASKHNQEMSTLRRGHGGGGGGGGGCVEFLADRENCR